MLLTISTTHQPATDLGHLLRKNPARAQTFELSFGKANVFYPEVSATRCTAALLLEVDADRTSARPARPGGRGTDAGAVRERSALCRLLLSQRGDRGGLRQRALRQK